MTKVRCYVTPNRLIRLLTELGELEMLAFTSIGMLAFLLVADTLIQQGPFAAGIFGALFDSLAHGIVALVVTCPLFGMDENRRRATALFWVVLLSGTLLDLDHLPRIVAAGSLDLPRVLGVSMRPPTHSLTFAGVAGAFAYLVSRSRLVGWGMFAALSSHVLRDASGGYTSILWPLSLQAIPQWIHYPSQVGLLVVSYLLMKKGWR
jgi:membrane-bound metal-dependent hydrolase YbcI (DUF457 family)